ncbi:cytochrome c nitrite reductase small subunit [Pelagicoccus sp. SDUM812002]|uniref:cytochrome c nitrite reductase small subunit n=1 Tax=Pelagicoccus sp. SDUM812002 TaxID=3041266 RepID=UPI00280C99B1|nr:cytochrome c nitrite reductase small subunit [Pelagicoccus sp. SDUM812002]MDQ8187099.1 cytochrome c nitrite reductase small subunit [Pelagicoccus sp. SDUM812002]
MDNLQRRLRSRHGGIRLPQSLAAIGLGYMVLAGSLGLASGVGLFTFGYGQGASYLSNKPEACVNCHVMQDYYDTWQKSSHHHVAVCNDCHLSHHPLGKWVTKADNGFFHSLAFTLDNYHKPIRIKPRNRRVTQNACLHCHEEVAHDTLLIDQGDSPRESLSCVRCHSSVGHAHR